MPNEHGQITENDFKAPEGQFRIIWEQMEDGHLEIVADYFLLYLAEETVSQLRAKEENDVFTLFDDQGVVIS